MSRRLISFWLKNYYVNTSVQKGGISGMPGCLEHSKVTKELLKYA